ncbi:MAG: lytic transglycosylase domain-containing protein [Alphaproteobacteria bacterium]
MTFLIAVCGGLSGHVANAAPPGLLFTVAPPTAGAGASRVTLPDVLSPADAARYARIFELQKRGKWHAADHEIKRLEDRILMGQVLAQRYLHPTHYRSKFRELRDWLKKYADHPQARRIYKLAMKRRPKGAAKPRRPVAPAQPVGAVKGAAREKGYVSPRKRSRAQRRKLINLLSHIRRHIRRGQPKSAAKHLDDKSLLRLADDVEFDIMRRETAYAYFLKGNDKRAYALATPAAARSGHAVPLIHWTAGLIAYRLGDVEAARRHFESLAAAGNAADETIAAGAYWAARLNLITRRPENVSRLLAIAAAHPRTFHGLIANRALGKEPDYAWELPRLTTPEMAVAMQVPAAKRALALVEAGQARLAESEIRRLDGGTNPALGKALLALATHLRLPAAQLRIARRLSAVHGHSHDGAMYPVPQWEPKNGYVVDRALVFALVRQESEFNARAKSHAGARGLMQLMPRTASFIARDRRYRTSRRNELYRPEVNIALGQKYVLHLAEVVAGNLVYLVAAYNGGPGNVRKWIRRNRFNNDPLLFIETVRSEETRKFIQHVLTNLWVYRARLGQRAPSLDAIAGGQWPRYTSQDSPTVAFAADAAG